MIWTVSQLLPAPSKPPARTKPHSRRAGATFERTAMTLFLHGLGIGLLFAGALGLLWLAVELFLNELRNLR